MQIIEVTGLGVRSAVIRLRRRHTPLQFVIYPMLHVGQPGFYATVTTRLHTAQVVVAEGVRRGKSARGSVLLSALTLSYRVSRLRRRSGLIEQKIDYKALGVPVLNPDIDTDELHTTWRQVPFIHRLMVWCVLPLVILGRLFGGGRVLWSKATEVNDMPSDEDEQAAEAMPQLQKAFGGDRDDRLMATLQQLHEERGTEAIEVAVVYGAAHVPAIVHGLLDRYGYVPVAAGWVTVVDLSGRETSTTEQAESTVRTRPVPRPRAAQRKPVPVPTPARGEPATDAAPRPKLVFGARSTTKSSGEDWAAAVARLRALAAAEPDQFLPALVRALIALSDHLADQGQPDEAVAAADEAVDLGEGLHDRYGASHADVHGLAAYTLGRRLSDLDRDEDTAALYAEAVEIFRAAFPDDPDRRIRVLGSTINTYAGHLLWLQRNEEAAAAAEEALDLLQTADSDGRDEFLRLRALSLHNLTKAHRASGRTEPALEAANRAVELSRRLARLKPDQSGILVDNLDVLSRLHRDSRRTDEAVATAREAVEAARWLVNSKPAGEARQLGQALDNLGFTLSWSRRSAEVVPVAAEAVDVWRAVAVHHPRYVNSFGRALGRYADCLLGAGEGDLGLASAEEAEQVVRELTVTNPGRASALLAALLDDLWRSYRATNQAERALELTTEALRLNRVLVERDAHQAAQLRDALGNHADLLDAVGLSTQAQAVRDELRAPGGVTGTVGETRV